MEIIWKITEIEWVNKLGTSEKVIDLVSYRCEASQDSHTCYIRGSTNLISKSYKELNEEAYNSIISQDNVQVKDFSRIEDYEKNYNEETEEWETAEEATIKYDTTVYEFSSSENFTEYESLTETQVIDWVKSSLGQEKITEIETAVSNILEEDLSLENKKFRHTSSLPWGNN